MKIQVLHNIQNAYKTMYNLSFSTKIYSVQYVDGMFVYLYYLCDQKRQY